MTTSSTSAGRPVTISIVVPVYSGEDYLARLADAVEALRADLTARDAPFNVEELIFVDDSAVDESAAVIDRIAAERPWVVALHLSRNFGQHAATVAGILHSAGDWVVTMDEDLQHPPDRLPELLRKAVGDGADLVYANPETAVHDAAIRDATSRGFKRFMEWLTGNPRLRDFNSFRLIRGPIARAVSSVCAHDTYFDINLSWFTQRISVVRMALRDERYITTGKSGYSLKSLFGHAFRMLFSSQIRLLRLGALLGLGVMGLSLLGMLYYLGVKIFAPEMITVQGWTSLFLAITFFGGLMSFMIGIALQYLSTLVLKAHGKPTFFTIDRSDDRRIADWFAAGPK